MALSPFRRGCLLALAAGVFGILCWLPTPLAVVYPLYPFLLFQTLRQARTNRDALLFGIIMGASRFLVGSHFLLVLVSYSPLGVVFYLLATLYILPYAMAWTWGPFWLERRTGVSRVLWAIPVYALMDWTRTVGDLSFPSELISHALGNTPAWLAWTPFLGPYGTALFLFGVGLLLDQAWERRGRRGPALAFVAAALLVWFLPVLTFALSGSRPGEGAPLRVAIVQPCITPEEKLDPRHSPEIRGRLETLVREAARGADLVVLPETARPDWVVWKDQEPFRDEEMEALAREVGVPLLYGCLIARVLPEGGTVLYNGAALAHPDGRPSQWYGKQRLLPLAEAVPFARALGWDPSQRKSRRSSYLTMMGNFTPGPAPTIFEVGEARIGVLICYEGFYPHLVRRYRLEGANMLAVLTNDAWWGHSVFPLLHSRMIAARVREADLPTIRAANNGISSYTDARGRQLARSELDERSILRVEVPPAGPSPTLYTRTGDILVLVLWVLVGAGVLFGLFRRRA